MSVFGIDVSSFNVITSWQDIRDAGKEFCIIQAGNDLNGQNSMLMNHVAGCDSVGIKYGLYWFCYALNTTEAYQNGQLCGQIIQQNNLQPYYPVYYDVERTGYHGARAGSVEYWEDNGITPTPVFCQSIITAFCNGLKSVIPGIVFGVYFNQSMFVEFDYASMFLAHTDWSHWIAQWDPYEPSWTTWDIWQYGEGPVNGHTGNVDLNVLHDGWTPPTPPGPTPGTRKLPIWFYLKFPF